MADTCWASLVLRVTFTDFFKYTAASSLLLLSLFACEREVAVPHYLIGEWETADHNYADRYMKFTERTVVYGVGEGAAIANTIDKIDMKQASFTVFTFYYTGPEGERGSLTFTYTPDSGGAIQLKNSNHIWKKKKSGEPG